MNKRHAFEALKNRMNDLPSIPVSVARVTDILNEPDSTISDLVAAISEDQSLATKILKIVNSAYYGFPRRIDNLEQAVTMLGYRAINEIILVTSLFNASAPRSSKPILDRQRFWKHAVGCGTAAKAIAKRINIKDADSVFLAGLIHDIGKVFLDAYLQDEYATVISLVKKKDKLIIEAEEEILGANHTEFGHWLADEWNLPLNLTTGVLHHHHPNQAHEHYLLACLVHVGDILARALEIGYGGDELIPAISHEAWSSLNLTTKLLEDIIEEDLNPDLTAFSIFSA